LAGRISAALMDLQAQRVRLHCQHCEADLGTVHAPAPPVPVTCSACRNAR
jgi:peptide methionine sulfoxide reductase MsrB